MLRIILSNSKQRIILSNSKYLIRYLNKVIRPFVLILPRMSRYVKAFKAKNGNKYKNNKLMFFHIDDGKSLKKYETIWTKIEGLLNIELNALPVYDDEYKKNKKEHMVIKFILILAV